MTMTADRRYSRLDRVNEALREVIADELERVDDDVLELVTVTGVKVDPDLRHAQVWFDTLGDNDEVARALARHRVRLQAAIGREMRLKRTPELTFAADPARAVGTRVEEILRGLGQSPSPAEGDAGRGGWDERA